jgi:hypothetical protein
MRTRNRAETAAERCGLLSMIRAQESWTLHWRVCVPPFEIIGLCGVALIIAAVMFGTR